MRVEDVDIVEVHALQRLIERVEDVLTTTATRTVGAFPHVVTGLGHDDHFIAILGKVVVHVATKVRFG